MVVYGGGYSLTLRCVVDELGNRVRPGMSDGLGRWSDDNESRHLIPLEKCSADHCVGCCSDCRLPVALPSQTIQMHSDVQAPTRPA